MPATATSPHLVLFFDVFATTTLASFYSSNIVGSCSPPCVLATLFVPAMVSLHVIYLSILTDSSPLPVNLNHTLRGVP
jgi:hypothetical protein